MLPNTPSSFNLPKMQQSTSLVANHNSPDSTRPSIPLTKLRHCRSLRYPITLRVITNSRRLNLRPIIRRIRTDNMLNRAMNLLLHKTSYTSLLVLRGRRQFRLLNTLKRQHTKQHQENANQQSNNTYYRRRCRRHSNSPRASDIPYLQFNNRR